MESQYQKEKEFQKIQKKLGKGSLPLEELLVEEGFVEMFRVSHKALHSHLKFKDFKEMVVYVTVPGPPEDKLRSYKYPLVCAEILSSEIPRILDVMFSAIQEQSITPTLFSLLMNYFEGPPNDTLSGYVIKILTPLYTYEPVKTQQAIIQSGQLFNIPKFMHSRSISDFLVRQIVVESQSLLTIHFKQRKELLLQLIAIYQKGEKDDVYMLEVVYSLAEVITRLWNDKHKELGKMAQTLIRIIQTVVSKSQLFQQQFLMHSIMINLVNFSANSAHLIKIIVSKSYKELFLPSQETLKTSKKAQVPKLGLKKFYLLKSLTLAITHCPKVVEEIGSLHLLLCKLLELVVKHEWNSMLHVEVELIFKELFKEGNTGLVRVFLDKWSLTDTIKEMIRKEEKNLAQGYSGTLINISTILSDSIKSPSETSKYLKSKQPLLSDTLSEYLTPKLKLQTFNLAGYRSNSQYSKPQYNQQDLLTLNKQFFQNVSTLEEMEKLPVSTSVIPEEVYEEIENENIVNTSWVLKPAEKV